MNRVIRNDDQLEQAIELMRRGYQELQQNGLSMSVEFKEHKAPKTSKQHRKMFGMLGELGNFLGKQDMLSLAKTLEFWPDQIHQFNGEIMIVPKSETKITKEEMSQIIDGLFMVAIEIPGFEFSRA